MIASSQAYNPSQQGQQPRHCIGINQQNSIYGPDLAPQTTADMSQLRPPTHMFDLATLQQEHQATNSNNLFDSAYDATTNSLAALNNFRQSDHLSSSHAPGKTMNNSPLKQHQTTDMSLYSPSSSTSLLYHHYDQINVPNDQSVNNNNNNHNSKRSTTTTILNPSDLFGQSTLGPQQVANQQHFMTASNKTKIGHQELYGNSAQYHLHQPSINSMHHLHQPQQQQQQLGGAYGPENHQLMLDTILRQQHATAAATMSRAAHHQVSYHNRPLSSSGASSMSGQSMGLTYGRQPSQAAGSQLPPLPPMNTSKGQNTLASVLQSNQTLNHLNLGLNSQLTPKKLSHHHQFHSTCLSPVESASRNWKRAQQRVQSFAQAYAATLLRYSILLIIIAFSIVSILKYTSNNAPAINGQLPIAISGHQEPTVGQSGGWSVAEPTKAGESSALPPDVLSSRLLIGEFVILSQNYSNSDAQRSVLAENIVKLMDQVFLSTDMRRLYSRMRVTEILPHKPRGLLVKCNIILAESITYAAQQFGIALYDSLVKSNEKLSNHQNFIIDKNSIRFNTIPDKDLANVPIQLLPPGLERPDATAAPSSEPANKQLQDLETIRVASSPFGPAPDEQDQNAVVWSEWSVWSSCVDKNGMCDSSRLHSRVRKCVSQHTGEKVDASECKRRFDSLDQELEVSDCSATCAMSSMGPSVQSDEPHSMAPFTVPPAFLLHGPPLVRPPSAQRIVGPFDSSDAQSDPYPSLAPPSSSPVLVTQTPGTASSSGSAVQDGSLPTPVSPVAKSHIADGGNQISCSNCTANHICLLQLNDKVPFCALIKDRLDESGCGGWCKAGDQICVPAGENAFKCTHNSECLPNEWRCQDSACIPASKRCDGHDNCFDSSDEQFCPEKPTPI